jgi:hypothetical protein
MGSGAGNLRSAPKRTRAAGARHSLTYRASSHRPFFIPRQMDTINISGKAEQAWHEMARLSYFLAGEAPVVLVAALQRELPSMHC